jgi:hypothetical protein
MRVLFCTLVVLAATAGLIAISPGADPRMFWDFPSVAFILFTWSLFMCGAYSPRELASWLGLGLGFRAPTREAETLRARQICIVGGLALGILVLVGGMVGAIIILRNLNDPSMIGPPLAFMILQCLYAALPGGVFLTAMWAQIGRAAIE